MNILKSLLAVLPGFKGDSGASVKPKDEAQVDFQLKRNVAFRDLLDEAQGAFGRVFLISLDDIFAVVDQRSERLEAGVHMICQRAIGARVGASGVFGPIGEGGYFFRFDEPNDERAWAKAVAIVNEIGTKIFGAAYRPDATPPVISLAVVPAAGIRAGEDGVDKERVAQALRVVKGKPRKRVFLDWRKFSHDKAERPDVEWQTIERRKPAAAAEWMPAPSGAAKRPVPGADEAPSRPKAAGGSTSAA